MAGEDTVSVMWFETGNPWHSSATVTDVDRAALAALYSEVK